jgi:hypothetical protein
MSKKVPKVSDITKADKNPYLNEVRYGISMKKRGILVGTSDKLLTNPVTGETEQLKMVGSYKTVDPEQFVKIYTNRVSSMFELSKAGNKVFGYVLNKVEMNSDEIYIYIQDLMLFCNWGEKRQAYQGLAELVAAQIIYPSTKPNIWFINPNILFNGDRVALIDQYKIQRKEELQKPKIPVNTQFETQGDYARAIPATTGQAENEE